MRAWIEDERRFRRHVISLPPGSAHVELTDTVIWYSERNGYDGKEFSVYEVLEDPRTGIRQLSLRERDPADYAWSPSYALPRPPTPTPSLPALEVGIPGYAVERVEMIDADGETRRAGIRLKWADIISAQGIRWEIRLAGATAVILTGDSADLTTGQRDIYDGILPATGYELRARLMANRPTRWMGWMLITTADVRTGALDLSGEITA